ncbi:hypothetical protein GCM10023189_10990 [Nibrella saemangeumensis]|uniref:Uncharacterized protein n=1 Tax=Nibrella saemangeumensis TaxID=1084526 RepID=A0ABP8MJY6_9BACT
MAIVESEPLTRVIGATQKRIGIKNDDLLIHRTMRADQFCKDITRYRLNQPQDNPWFIVEPYLFESHIKILLRA